MQNIAKYVFETEIEQLQYTKEKLNHNFQKAIDLILQSKGRLVITGMGKSGHIGVKIAATLASTGTPSFFMHPAEAIHGDLGMLTPHDIVLAISNSGESEEIVKIIPHIKRMGISLIGMAGNPSSTLATQSHVFLDIGVKKEACPLQLAPTSSTTVTLVMGDALAVALMQEKKFQPENFAMFHPGGSLGRKLLTKVEDIMHTKNLPIVTEKSSFQEVIHTMTSGKLGLCLVMEENQVKGIITDGDLRRALEITNRPRFDLKAKEMMTPSPKTIPHDTMAVEAESFMLEHKINELIVVHDKKVVGIVQLYDTGAIS